MPPRDARPAAEEAATIGVPANLSRRRFLLRGAGTVAGAFVLGFGLPAGRARAAQGAAARGTNVPAFLEIRPDGTVRLFSPFIEGGQGTFTAMAQIVGEELDADPAKFVVENAPPGPDFVVMDNGQRITGGSMSIRYGYAAMRRLGALARAMLLQAASLQWRAPVAELTTEPGRVVHARSGRWVAYGDIAPQALDLPVPDPASVTLKHRAQFRWIGQPLPRLDIHDKSTGQIRYSIDQRVDGMLQAAIQHAPRLGMTVGGVRNRAQVEALHGVHAVHVLPGAVAVTAERWWHAKRAAEALRVDWREAAPGSPERVMPADFSTAAFQRRLEATPGAGDTAEIVGEPDAAFARAKTTVQATYASQFLKHAQMEPPSALARFDAEGGLEVWLPNQAPDIYRADMAARFGLAPEKITLHSPLLGGFFGRYFLYASASPHLQAIQLARDTGRPVKVIWSREEEFLRDPMRPMAAVRLRGALDADGLPIALEAVSVTEGPVEGMAGKRGPTLDDTALEGLTGKAYAIANRRIAQVYVPSPMAVAYWRSVGHSMNDFFYESFLDELADQGGQDPYALRLRLLANNARLARLLNAAGELSGGWKRGPYLAPDGSRRARGVAMASPFDSHAAAIAEVSLEQGQVRVHEIWEAIDPGNIVNPAIVEAQVRGAVTLGLSQVLLEESVYENGMPRARNFDLYPILPPDRMPKVHVRIVVSGEKIGGVGEPPLPAVPPAVANAVSHLVGRRVRSMPLSALKLDA